MVLKALLISLHNLFFAAHEENLAMPEWNKSSEVAPSFHRIYKYKDF